MLKPPFEYCPIGTESAVSSDLCLHLAALASQMSSVVEVGSWQGKSTHALLSGSKGTVYAVDHFRGSACEGDATHNRSGKEEFLKNCGHFSNLILLEMSSQEASKQFEDNSVDMVFIDAGHMYAEVTDDLRNWYPKVKKVICGHDWYMPEVKQAIVDFGLKCDASDGQEYWEFYKEKSDVAKQD